MIIVTEIKWEKNYELINFMLVVVTKIFEKFKSGVTVVDKDFNFPFHQKLKTAVSAKFVKKRRFAEKMRLNF